ncbi:MAG: UDP-N-acetylglucosamine--N-acetylmuramyl-(pentapeptide) pyrophosphoryl-undecaprenol N-acetylglucosamine transferase [Holosporales bacterium]
MGTPTTFILAAGGTGGHVMPALALAEEMVQNHHSAILMTDQRGVRYLQQPHAIGVKLIDTAPPSAGRLRFWLGQLIGFWQAVFYLLRCQPRAVVGFGGYPAMPTCLAAITLRIPLILHEQNAIIGRSNRFLKRFARQTILSFGGKQINVPVRQSLIHGRAQLYHPPKTATPFSLLVTGGSQGARVFEDLIPEALALLPLNLRQNLHVHHQVSSTRLEELAKFYDQNSIRADLKTFFANIQDLLANCHLAISRSGASSVAEAAMLGRPVILVPFPYAADDHQRANALAMADRGAAWVVDQARLTPHQLAMMLANAMERPGTLAGVAAAARALGNPKAAAEMLEQILRASA